MLVITLLPMVIASEPTNQELKMNLVQSFSLYVTSQTIDNFMMLKNSILAIFNRLDELESRPKSCNHGGGSSNQPVLLIESIEGDLDNDGDFDLDDWSIYKERFTSLKNNFGKDCSVDDCEGNDFDGNGFVDLDDFAKFKQEYKIFQEEFSE